MTTSSEEYKALLRKIRRIVREALTPEEHELYLGVMRERSRIRRAQMTPAQWEAKREQDREAQKRKRLTMTDEDRRVRAAKMKAKYREQHPS